MATNRKEIIVALAKYLDKGQFEARVIHIAILQKHYLELVLLGQKTIESRLSKRKIAPYQKVAEGDCILFKESGGEILAMAEVKQCWYYQNPDIDWCKRKFNSLVCGADNYWESKRDAKYASFILISGLHQFPQPIKISKKDGRGWVVFTPDSDVLGYS
ncbi:MAG: ASCH domain-containing protein [Microcoleaceae cyanobacterium]